MALIEDKYAQDSRSSEVIVAEFRRRLDDENSDASLAVVHYRAGKNEFSIGKLYAQSDDPLDRVTGACVLAQLGWGRLLFLAESVEILTRLLNDDHSRVIAAAAHGLGHRNDPQCIPYVLPLIHHVDSEVRLGVVGALSSHEHPAAIGGLIELSKDVESDVRSWAAFGLGTLIDVDSPELKDALVCLLDDEDAEIRGEALIGLARHKDPRVIEPLKQELAGPFYGNWCLDAAELLGESSMLPLLSDLKNRIPAEDMIPFQNDLAAAIQACKQ